MPRLGKYLARPWSGKLSSRISNGLTSRILEELGAGSAPLSNVGAFVTRCRWGVPLLVGVVGEFGSAATQARIVCDGGK